MISTILALCLSTFGAWGTPPLPSDEGNDFYTFEVTLQDGRTVDFYFAPSEWKAAAVRLDETYDVLACTVKFSTDECSTTASSCAGARAGFEACACEVGHDFFC